MGFKFSENIGKLYENIVFLHLLRGRNRHADLEIYYWRDMRQNETDFVIKRGVTIKQLIQVCYDIDNPETKKREIKALLKASKELRCRDLLIITEEKECREKIKGNKIKFMPLWKWLLDIG